MNGFFCHVKENAGHKIDWDKVVFVDYEKNWKRRKVKEAIYINAINPTNAVIKKGILNLEKGYELDAIWSEFNGFSGSRLLKKLGKQFNIVIVSIGSILVLFCFIWYSWRFQEKRVGFVQFQKCVLKKLFFSLELMMKPA